MTKHLFSDIDGTLLQNHEFNKTVLDKIKNFIAKGNHFYLATGRVDPDVKKIEKVIDIPLKYRISQNGAIITTHNDETIRRKGIPADILKQVASYVFAIDDVIIEFTTSEGIIYGTTDRQIAYLHEFTSQSIVDANIKNNIEDKYVIVFTVLTHDDVAIKKINVEVNKKFGDKIHTVITSPGCLDILSKEASKGLAIKQVQELIGIKSENIFVTGDSYNDVSMFDMYANSFAMSQAPKDVQSRANNVVNNVGDVVDFITKI